LTGFFWFGISVDGSEWHFFGVLPLGFPIERWAAVEDRFVLCLEEAFVVCLITGINA
jgi:hypothetical protein